jgi:hypothetical protein
MQDLQTIFIAQNWSGEEQVFEIREKDCDDCIVYEIFSRGSYLFTLSPDGKVIFDNVDRSDYGLHQYMPALIGEIRQVLHI